jgi:hypothetical protein
LGLAERRRHEKDGRTTFQRIEQLLCESQKPRVPREAAADIWQHVLLAQEHAAGFPPINTGSRLRGHADPRILF